MHESPRLGWWPGSRGTTGSRRPAPLGKRRREGHNRQDRRRASQGGNHHIG
jgi:hypothetical protein